MSNSPWRPTLKVEEMADLLVDAAIQLQLSGITDPEEFKDPGNREDRAKRAGLANTIIVMALEAVAGGTTGKVVLDGVKEPFFERARTKPREHEVYSQKIAIANYLGIKPDREIVISETQLVAGALKAAKDLGHGDEYTLQTLIRDGIRRVGQEMISNAVNKTNRDPESGPSHTAPGARWDAYEAAYLELKSILGTKNWTYRKPFITLSYIAGALKGPKSNVVQLRRWAEATGKPIVPAPLADEDQTAGGLIVDDKLEREED